MKAMKAPQVNDTPLHLEFILQMEGKTVLSYYLNQKMFSEMTFEQCKYALLYSFNRRNPLNDKLTTMCFFLYFPFISFSVCVKCFCMVTVFNRINLVILADSHINMQLVRWPFMTKYNVPTVLGTHADVLLQTTVLSSLRGNITQHQFVNATKKTHQIDARYVGNYFFMKFVFHVMSLLEVLNVCALGFGFILYIFE